MRKFFLLLVLLVVFAIIGWFLYYYLDFSKSKVQLNEEVMIEQIADIGKLELVKYSMKDVIERKELRSFYLPDQRVLFVAVGEVTGCIDLRKIQRNDIVKHKDDSVTLYLPKPEICYVKIDHQRSKVYDVSGAWLPGDTQHLVEGIYKVAEDRLLQNAKEMDVLGKTEENAYTIFKPMIENITGVKVDVKFR